MPHRAILTPADDLFGRVALFNNLVTLEQIVECARAIGAEIVAGRPRRSLATVLILKGYLAAKAAGTVEAAIRRRLAAQHGAAQAPVPAAPTPKPPPLKDRAPDGTSQIVLSLEDDDAHFFEAPASADRLRRIVARLAPGLIYPEMLNHITRHSLTVLDTRKLAAAIGEQESDVIAALHHWQGAGIIKTLGAYPYCYSPSPHEEQDIAFLMEAWRDPRRHARVLGDILANGK